MLLRNITIKNKLTAILMATSAMAVALVCLTFYFLEAKHFQKTYLRDMENLAHIVGHNCTAALLFNVPEDAESVLGSLHSRQSVIAAHLYDTAHRLFATYKNTDTVVHTPSAHQELTLDPERYMKFERPITLNDGTIVGRIVIYDDIREITLSKQKGMLILAVVGIVAMLAAFLLASFLQNIISHPLLALTAAVQRLASGDFASRHEIHVQSQDEVGMLSAAFVDMSQKLENSYAQLEAYSQELEKRVAARTEELQQALHDLTKSQEQLIQSEKMVALGHLVAGVAHEINNNINFIAGAVPSVARLTQELAAHLNEDGAAPQATRDKSHEILLKIDSLLHNAEVGVQRTTKIVSELNTFARPSQGRLSYVDIQQEIDMVLTLLRFQLRDRIEVRQEFPADLPLVPCLRDQMNQVYMNVLRNAIQAIPDKGAIVIRAWLADDMVNISVTDSGCGIADAVRNNIFHPFFTTKNVGEGTGLGLSISYSIMKSHHGEIVVESTGSAGTTFILRLPVTPPRQTPASPLALFAGLDQSVGMTANAPGPCNHSAGQP